MSDKSVEESVKRIAYEVVPEITHLQVQKEMELLEEKYLKKKLFDFNKLFPTKIVHVYLITEDGMLVAHGFREKEGTDPDIIAGMVTAVTNFIEDAFVDDANKHNLEKITKGELIMLIEYMPPLFLLVIIKGRERPEIRMSMKKLLKRLFEEHEDVLKNWDGDREMVEEVEKKIKLVAHYTYL